MVKDEKNVFVVSILFSQFYICDGQTRDNATNQVESVKVEYMSKELNLTPDESKNSGQFTINTLLKLSKQRKIIRMMK